MIGQSTSFCLYNKIRSTPAMTRVIPRNTGANININMVKSSSTGQRIFVKKGGKDDGILNQSGSAEGRENEERTPGRLWVRLLLSKFYITRALRATLCGIEGTLIPESRLSY